MSFPLRIVDFVVVVLNVVGFNVVVVVVVVVLVVVVVVDEVVVLNVVVVGGIGLVGGDGGSGSGVLLIRRLNMFTCCLVLPYKANPSLL